MTTHLATWISPHPQGIYVNPADAWIDPSIPKPIALVTHGHADHARAGHGKVLATPETLAIMCHRFGPQPGAQAIGYGETVTIGDVSVRFVPAGHVLGSAQIVLEYAGERVVVSGDYKRRADGTCKPFEPVACDVFITEATFGLPVFRHPDAAQEIAKVLAALALEPERTMLIGAYALGKSQRLIHLLRSAGYHKPIYLHGALIPLVNLYEQLGVPMGDVRPAAGEKPDVFRGHIVMAPPSALNDRWSRRMLDPVTAMASGWMQVRQRAKQRNVELPLVISDHADWDELTQTITDIKPQEVWVTHGREEALIHWCARQQIKARALSLLGRNDEEEA